jgi:broad specificity polyphosphatase/5'/3'-nucleotidase SurE
MWGVDLLNVNFPDQPTNKVRFTKIYRDISKIFTHPIGVDKETHHFTYHIDNPIEIKENQLRYDVGALNQGYISISPCVTEMTHFLTFKELKDQQLEL